MVPRFGDHTYARDLCSLVCLLDGSVPLFNSEANLCMRVRSNDDSSGYEDINEGMHHDTALATIMKSSAIIVMTIIVITIVV